MSSTYPSLAEQATAAPAWKWKDGMRVIRPPRHNGATGYTIRLEQDGYRAAAHEYPDLSDPATLGCILSIIREHYGRTAYVKPTPSPFEPQEYCYTVSTTSGTFTGSSEAAALVAALSALRQP